MVGGGVGIQRVSRRAGFDVVGCACAVGIGGENSAAQLEARRGLSRQHLSVRTRCVRFMHYSTTTAGRAGARGRAGGTRHLTCDGPKAGLSAAALSYTHPFLHSMIITHVHTSSALTTIEGALGTTNSSCQKRPKLSASAGPCNWLVVSGRPTPQRLRLKQCSSSLFLQIT